MIKKTLLTALVIFIIYEITIPILLPTKQIEQHIWQGNKIKAQNYVYNPSKNEISSVIVGSSLSAKIKVDSMKGFYNLALDAQSIFDGLHIIQNKTPFPQNIYIEMNVLLKQEDPQFVNSLFNPFIFYTQKYLPALRAGKEPLAILGAAVSRVTSKLFGNLVSKTQDLNPNTPSDTGSSTVFKKLLGNQISSYKKIPDSLALEKALSDLQTSVRFFQQRNVNVVFFEMPVNENLCNLALPESIRKRLFAEFPRGSVSYIDQPECLGYSTSDGIHLTPVSVKKYTAYFQEKIKCNYCQ